jgi:hypothetical protein
MLAVTFKRNNLWSSKDYQIPIFLATWEGEIRTVVPGQPRQKLSRPISKITKTKMD